MILILWIIDEWAEIVRVVQNKEFKKGKTNDWNVSIALLKTPMEILGDKMIISIIRRFYNLLSTKPAFLAGFYFL